MNSLVLSKTSATGSLSHLSSASKLYHLDVSYTNITGSTSDLSHLSDLNYLSINENITETAMTNACGTLVIESPLHLRH